MADADHDAVGQRSAKRSVQRELLTLVERGRRLVEEHHLGFGQQHPGERDALLLTRREHVGPVGILVEPVARCPSVTASSAAAIAASS